MRKVIGIGETILDIIFKNDQPHTAVPGGSVFNGLVSLGRLGVPVSFISEVGNDHVGEIIRRFMEENQSLDRICRPFPGREESISLAFLDNENKPITLFIKIIPNNGWKYRYRSTRGRYLYFRLLLLPESGSERTDG